MELKLYFGIILKRLWIILLLTIVSGCATAYYSYYIIKPVYMANTTLYLINKSYDSSPLAFSDLQMAGQLIMDYTELIESRNVQEAAIQDLRSKGISVGSLGNISANGKTGTRVINITVQHTDPVMAMEIANSVARVFSKKVVDLMKIENVNIIDEATKPQFPISPQPLRNIGIAVSAAVFLAFGVIFLIEYLDNTIKTSEDVGKYLGLPVIGTIPMLGLKIGGR